MVCIYELAAISTQLNKFQDLTQQMIKKDTLLLLIPYIGSIFIFFGFIKLLYFYYLFGINISEYLELTEIITLFFKDILFFSALILIITLVSFISFNKNFSNEKNSFDYNENNTIKRLKNYFKGNPIIPLTLLLMGFRHLNLAKGVDSWPFERIILVMWGVNLLLIIVHELNRKYYLLHGKFPNQIYPIMGMIFSVFTVFVLRSAYDEFETIKEKKSTFGSTVQLSDNTIISDSTYYFIGKTKDYIFFHNQRKRQTDIFPVSEVKKIQLKNSR